MCAHPLGVILPLVYDRDSVHSCFESALFDFSYNATAWDTFPYISTASMCILKSIHLVSDIYAWGLVATDVMPTATLDSYLGATMWQAPYTVYPASLLVGAGSAMLWVAEGDFITQIAMDYDAQGSILVVYDPLLLKKSTHVFCHTDLRTLV